MLFPKSFKAYQLKVLKQLSCTDLEQTLGTEFRTVKVCPVLQYFLQHIGILSSSWKWLKRGGWAWCKP